MILNGVRTGRVALRGAERPDETAHDLKSHELERSMTLSLRENLHVVSDPQHLDSTVDEVFQMMLGSVCRRIPQAPAEEAETITAVVGFGGLLSGACVFYSGASTALAIAARLTGMEFTEIDDTVKDAIGEICNMLAGAWKGRFPQLAANCGLSIPAVITGSNYRIHVQAPEFQLQHVYGFDDFAFTVTLICDGLQ
jgi:chemotaxis protein CheX